MFFSEKGKTNLSDASQLELGAKTIDYLLTLVKPIAITLFTKENISS